MGRHDWCRKSSWSPEDQADFFKRLARSRSGRDQYLLIQAAYLRSAGHADPALKLVEQYFTEFPADDLFHVSGTLQKAQCLEALGRIDEAEQAYLATVIEQRQVPNHTTTVYTDFPWFVVKHGRKHLYSDALAALDAATLIFPVLQYQAYAVRAMIAADRGDFDSGQRHASRALQAASATHSGVQIPP